MRVLIACGARGDIRYDDNTAYELGLALGEAGLPIMFGGGYGLMESVADGNREAGMTPIGVSLNSIVRKRQSPHQHLVYECETLSERKAFMLVECKAAVVLPGGLGTMDELFELACAKKLGHWSGPIVLLNVRGFWDHLLMQLRTCVADGYWNGDNSIFTVVETVDEAVAAVRGTVAQHADTAE